MARWKVVWWGLFSLGLLAGCQQSATDSYRAIPTQVAAKVFPELEPSRLQTRGDTLFVAYNGLPRIDAYDLSLRRLSSVALSAPETIRPTGFAVTDSLLVVVDHGRGVVAIFGREGKLRYSFDKLPDGTTRLQPIAVMVFRGVAYVADMGSGLVLAISLVDVPDITEAGELILSIPGPGEVPLGFPSAIGMTPDGRLLIGDAGRSAVGVFTCEGSRVYSFEPVPGLARLAPQGFARDNMPDPALQNTTTFDPSGARRQGRQHLLDGYNGRIHIFNPFGRYLASYPLGERLAGPSGIAAGKNGELIFVADPPTHRILVFGLKGE